MTTDSNVIRVMIIDRNQTIQSWLADCLESSATNYRVSVAQTYVGGLQAMRSDDHDIFIVASGQDYVKKIEDLIDQSLHRMLPLIVIGDSDDLGAGDDLVAKGASDFLYIRQVTGDLLDRLVRNALERHNRMRQLLSKQHELAKLVRRDPLTGLVSRMVLQKQIEVMLYTEKQAGAMLYLDLDGFKAINDSYGHLAGDEVLQAVAVRLVESVRPDDVVGRLGGDEFLIYLAMDLDDDMLRNAVAGVCEKILKQITKPYQLMLPNRSDITTVRLSASIGVALTPRHSTEYVDLVHMADQSMYQAKALGRSTFCFHNEINAPAEPQSDRVSDIDVATGRYQSLAGIADKVTSPFDG